jgi:hypothetical protein
LLYRSNIIRSRHAFFNETNIHCDSEACLEFLEHHDFGFIHQVLTVNGVREDSLTSFSKSMQTFLPWILRALVIYGPKYLTGEERESLIREHLRQYYRHLGAQIYNRRGSEFWNYHKRELAALGYPMSATRLAAATTFHALDLVNPRGMVKGVVRRFRRSPASSSS